MTIEKTHSDEYALLDLFGDNEIRVFTTLGRTLKGKVINRVGKNIILLESQTNRQAYINLDHIISITGSN